VDERAGHGLCAQFRAPQGLDTAQAVLTLRAIATTGDLAQYWRYHQQQEHHRTYSASTTPTTPALAA
jgi:hypothetical protein